MADASTYSIVLVNNKNVEALRTGMESTFEDIRRETDWKPYDSTYTATPKTTVWLKFELENKSKDTIINYLYSSSYFNMVYQQSNGEADDLEKNFFVPVPERMNLPTSLFTALRLLPFQKSEVYVKLGANNAIGPNIPEIYSQIKYLEFSSNNYHNQVIPIGIIYFYIISLITIFVFALVFWLRLLEKLYLYYLGYLLFQLVYGFAVLRYTVAPIGNFFKDIPELANDLFEPVQFIFIGFYVLFILQLLQVKEYDKLLAKALYYLALFCFFYAVFNFSISHFLNDFKYMGMVYLIIRSIILPLNLLLIFWIIYKVKHPLLIYFIVGQSFFFIGSILSTYIAFTNTHYIPGHFFNFKESPNIIFQMGLLAEVYCFSLALGKNVFILQKEKEKTSADLIEQLQKNQQIQEHMNRDLDQKVNEKTYELISLYSQIEREREQKTKDDFIKKIRETEMMALRSQMNPHFIFNSMNAIKNLIMTSRNEDAINYLDDFASLLRSILQNSNREKITVEDELEILELYLSLEKSRMDTDFSYTIQVTCKEELSQFEIPPLLLQPIVENAIWHGLHPSLKTEKKLTIIFDTTKNLIISIEDNGVGRKESAKKKKLHDSMGNSIVQDRLSLYNHLNDHTIHLKITDLEEDDQVLGTRTTLTYEY
ncbi:MAG TPA: histidine kinase [Edaphocola sp.]|nr:histidine kinase [Edaphocola sp.]